MLIHLSFYLLSLTFPTFLNFHLRFYVFRSWGRVGTTIGGTKLEDFDDLTEAKESFKFQFADKTGNRWSKRKEFAKKAGKMQGRYSTHFEKIMKIIMKDVMKIFKKK